MLLKPARYLKSLVISSTSRNDSTDEDDEGTFITRIRNIATVEEVTSGKKVGTMIGAAPAETKEVADRKQEHLFGGSVEDMMQKAQTVADIAKETVMTSFHLEEPKTTTEILNEEKEQTPDVAMGSVEDIMQKAHAVADIAKEAVMTSLQTPIVLEDPKVTASLEKEERAPDVAAVGAGAKEVAGTELGIPKGERWAVASPGIDLTGRWKIVVTGEFKQQYDDYLKNLGQPVLVRSIALSIIGMTREETKQTDQGRSLWIKGTNTRGIWERTLHASGSDFTAHVLDHQDFEHRRVPIVTADSEKVEAEAWWEDGGTVHRSWLRGGKKYGGGDFESRRYLSDENTLICETIFHPTEEKDGREKARMTWTFRREEPFPQ